MKREVVNKFLNKHVKLVKKDDWCLYGEIIEIFDECIIFRTKRNEAIIILDNIKEIVGDI